MTKAVPMEIAICLATSLDGKIAEIPGGAPNFTSRYDREKLFKLRAMADVLIVGANTVRQEQLPPLIRDPESLATRKARGLKPHPDVVLVSASMNLPWDSDYFKLAQQSISVLTGSPAPSKKQAAEDVGVQVIETGEPLDLKSGIGKLNAMGYRQALCEGGGTLVAGMLAEGLADRLYLTLAPTFIGGHRTPTLVNGPVLKPRPEFELLEVTPVESELHLVYQKQPHAASPTYPHP